MKNRRGFIKQCLGILGGGWILLRSRLANAKKLAVPLTKVPGLGKVGGWAKVKLVGKEILFVRVDAKHIKGIDPKCTHRDCPVKYNEKTKKLDCTCHGSSFDLNGGVLKGPASKALKTYPTALEGDRIIITID